MAKVSYLNLDAGSEALYKKVLQAGDRFTFSRVRVKDQFLSRSRVKGITQKSLLPEIAAAWGAMSAGQQDAWNAAGITEALNGYKAFVADTVARRKAGITGYATPNNLYQGNVGRIQVLSPATGLQLEQAHPLQYFVLHKVTGTRSQYSPKAVTEPFSFPLVLGASWHTALTSAGASPRARIFAVVYSSYQGQTLETVLEIPFGLTDAWQRATATLSTVIGPVQGYSVFIEVYNARGNLYFDNILIQHGGENWARDAVCGNISQSFTRSFYQVAKHWVPTNAAEGTDFGSVYYSG